MTVPTRATVGRPAAPVRILHLGLSHFFRVHPAWYTHRAEDADRWGIATFSGRAPGLAPQLARQDGLYTLVTQGPDGPGCELVSSVSAIRWGPDSDAWLGFFADPALAVVSSTITEAAYRRTESGELDVDHPFTTDDAAALREGRFADVSTPAGQLVAGLLSRRKAGAGPLTLLPLDNLPDNAAVVERVVRTMADLVDPTLSGWLDDNVGFVSSLADRVSPRPTQETFVAVRRLTGFDDPVAAVTEPFTEWVLAGEFKTERPTWESAGARFVDDLGPYEQRRLHLYGGAHTLLGHAGPPRGHHDVAQAMADRTVRGWVEDLWADALAYLDLPGELGPDYRAAMLGRLANPGIVHPLAQLAADGSLKLRQRIVPVLNDLRMRGRSAPGAERCVAAWVLHLRGTGLAVSDANAAEVTALASGDVGDAVSRVCDYLEIGDGSARESITRSAAELQP